jgi:hypothetical protein
LCGFVSDRKLSAIVLGAFDERPAIHAKIKKLTYHTPSRIGFRVNEEIRKAAQAFPEMRDLKLLQRLVAALATNEGVQSKPTEILQRLKS